MADVPSSVMRAARQLTASLASTHEARIHVGQAVDAVLQMWGRSRRAAEGVEAEEFFQVEQRTLKAKELLEQSIRNLDECAAQVRAYLSLIAPGAAVVESSKEASHPTVEELGNESPVGRLRALNKFAVREADDLGGMASSLSSSARSIKELMEPIDPTLIHMSTRQPSGAPVARKTQDSGPSQDPVS